jgi:hypothetical protein
MRKMKLEIDRLVVESFAIKDADTGGRGTVHGNAVTRFCTDLSACHSCTGSCYTYPDCQQVC